MKHGQAALTAVIFFLVAATAIGIGFTSFAFEETATARRQLRAKQSYFLAEAGAEDVAYRLQSQKNINSPETLTLNGETVTTIISTPSLGVKEILASGNALLNIRKVRLNLRIAPGASFNYGVQVGDGGLSMANSSKIIGSIYSNGDILTTSSAEITGDAFAAGNSIITNVNIGGNAQAYSLLNNIIGGTASSTTNIDDTTVGIHAYADTITGNKTISRDAYYNTSIAASVTVVGTKYPGTPAPVALPPLPMPINDSKIDEWKTTAEAGGIISSPCPYEPADGSSIGPIKIACDLIIGGTKIITLTGPVWVEGNFEMAQSAHLNLDPSYGEYSEVVIADKPTNRLTSSKVTMNNSVQINGSGTAGSYVLIISQNNSAEGGGTEKAIDTGQSGAAPIYYAPHGLITINNNTPVNLKEITGYRLELSQNSEVTYESGLANIYFSSGPGGGWEIVSWREVE